MTDENRVRTYVLSGERIMWAFFKRQMEGTRFVEVPIFEGIPEDAKLLAVETRLQPRTFEFLVEHPSFDPVPLGEYPPRFPGIDVMHYSLEVVWPERRQDMGSRADNYKNLEPPHIRGA